MHHRSASSGGLAAARDRFLHAIETATGVLECSGLMDPFGSYWGSLCPCCGAGMRVHAGRASATLTCLAGCAEPAVRRALFGSPV